MTTQELATTDAVIVGVPMMDATEARSVVTRIKTRIDLARGELLELKDREGWRALGYKSWGACAKAEFGSSAATLYRQLEAAEIARDLGDSQFENLPTNQLQAVKHLPPEQGRQALEQAYAQHATPTAKDVQQAAAEIALPTATAARVAAHQAELADMQRRFAVFDWKLTPHGLWYKLSKPDGSLYETVSDMARFVTLLSEMERSRANRIARGDPAYSEPAPALADIFLRLDAHGYAKSGTRTKGMTTFYSFRDYSGQSDAIGGEIELAEGELGYWLAELDTSASYAQAKQERFIDAQARATALGYDLTRDGVQFVLTPAGRQVPAMRGTLDQLIKTIEGYEKSAAKQAAAAPAPTLAELDALGMPVALHNAGYFWRSAAPPTIEGIDGWTGNAPTVEGAIEIARLRMDAKTEPITIFPALNQMECKALIREAKVFIERGLDRQYPTIGQALRIAARMALEATE